MKRLIARLPDAAYIELVRTLFATLVNTLIMAASFTAVSLIVINQTSSRPLEALAAFGVLAGIARVTVLLLYRKKVHEPALDVATAQRFERNFAIAYLAFAIALGAFSAVAFLDVSADVRMLVVGLLFGYGAGVSAGISLRPWISIASILIATTPTIVVASFFTHDVNHWATGALLAVFLAGGMLSMARRYRAVVDKINMTRVYETLARRDDLTGLPNRLSLRERFESAARKGQGAMIAVHCLDLDRFKPVNDTYGHPVGDLLLKAVSDRLVGLLRRDDFAARLGGDEFVVVQSGIAHVDEADMLARRIVRAIAQLYSIDGHDISIGTSVGYSLSSDHGNELERLIAAADAALYDVKRTGGGIASMRNGEHRQSA